MRTHMHVSGCSAGVYFAMLAWRSMVSSALMPEIAGDAAAAYAVTHPQLLLQVVDEGVDAVQEGGVGVEAQQLRLQRQRHRHVLATLGLPGGHRAPQHAHRLVPQRQRRHVQLPRQRPAACEASERLELLCDDRAHAS